MESKASFPFRLLRTGLRDGAYNMGLDEALLEAVARRDSLPVLRFYGWSPPAVSIGYFQGLEEEIDLASCARHGVDVIRRITGGGAVFHQAELTYSIILPDTHPLAGSGIQDSYTILCAGIVEGLALLGVPARFAPINDIIVNPSGLLPMEIHREYAGGRKISGNAQIRRKRCVLQHGTIMLENDTDLMFSLLKVPQEKMKGKLIQDVKDRVTSLHMLLGRPLSFDEAADSFTEGFCRALSLDFAGAPSLLPASAEDQRARELAAEKFGSEEWLRRR
ncbi:octanoyltransferase LipM [Spirochaetia bacterium]|nr:octanoyltransferase LipM [Spirochaetia bacterium]